MTAAQEMTLQDFIESKWFKGLARGFMILLGVVVPIGGTIVGWAIYDTKTAATTASEKADDVARVQAERARDTELFQQDVAKQFDELRKDGDALQLKLGTASSDIAEMKGSVRVILRQLQANDNNRQIGDLQ